MEINKFAKDVHAVAVEHGWWMEVDDIPAKLLMIHSEVSEAVDAYRHNLSISEELADVLIRTLDLMEYLDIDIEGILEYKHAKNKTRKYRHGNLLI